MTDSTGAGRRRGGLGRLWVAIGVLALLVALIVVVLRLVRSRDDGPTDVATGTGEYRDFVTAFHTGVAAMAVGETDRARADLERATSILPDEPAAWANLGILHLRLGDVDAAAAAAERARALAPDSSEIQTLLGLLEGRRGRFDEAVAHLRRAAELDPSNLKARVALAREIERRGGPDGDAEAQRQFEAALQAAPDNVALRLEVMRLAAKRGDAETLRRTTEGLEPRATDWPDDVRQRFQAVRDAAGGADPRQAATPITFLRNLLLQVPAFRDDVAAIESPPENVAPPIARFLKLPSPSPTPAPPDESLSYAMEPLGSGDVKTDVVLSVWLGGTSSPDAPEAPVIFIANEREVRRVDGSGGPLAFPSGPTSTPPTAAGVLALDWDYDFRTDFALAGAGGVRLFRQGEHGSFVDVTDAAITDAPTRTDEYAGAWATDHDLDGDLDVLLGTRGGPPVLLRNNGDGTFATTQPFPDVSGTTDFAWADLDGDGDADAALLDADGRLHAIINARGGRHVARALPGDENTFRAVTVADADRDGTLDVVAVRRDGSIVRVSLRRDDSWDVGPLAQWSDAPQGDVGLLMGDLDNNGGIDLLAAGPGESLAWLSDTSGQFQPLAQPIGARAFAAADLTGDGRLDLLGMDPAGKPVRLTTRGARDYHWQAIRLRAKEVVGDQRINSFGVGAEVEVRAGLLVQNQLARHGPLHFGLGEQTAANLARVMWPNGSVQFEFDLKADQSVLAEQRLKGSCPFLFANDGKAIRFVTDVLWRSPLGLRINAVDTAGATQTEDWVKIRGDQLAPMDGAYDLRITAELWETHYFDHVSLLVVDHAPGTEVFVDERFEPRTPPRLEVITTAVPRPATRATDDKGADVTERIRHRDGRYLDTFGLGKYQGITSDHYVEIELGPEFSDDASLWLAAHGWIQPTDSSLNVALAQGAHPPPRGLSLEVPDGAGGWRVVRDDIGFPAGKNKTILVRLDGLWPRRLASGPRRLRLRTNLEIYWDTLEIAEALTPSPGTPGEGEEIAIQRLSPSVAGVHYRGFSHIGRAGRSSPELPDYSRLVGHGPRWLDLEGYYTRFGDVRELLQRVDDRYVILNAGDEIALRFPAPPWPPNGWRRSFVFISEGWEKDGDFNTAWSKTVLPLPRHDWPAYDAPPGPLEDDPVYRRYPQDWLRYHTRYVTPDPFRTALQRGR